MATVPASKSDEKPNATKVEPTTEEKATLPRDVELLDDAVERKIDPFHQTGTMDTSGTGGSADNSIDAVSPIFREARRRDLQVAAAALDPDNDEVDADLVILPTSEVTVTGSSKTSEQGKDDVFRALEKANEQRAEERKAQNVDRGTDADRKD